MITRTGTGVAVTGTTTTLLGVTLGWTAPLLVGVGLLSAVALAAVVVSGPSRLHLDRSITPDRVAKGSPAIAYVSARNPGRLPTPATNAAQPFGGRCIPTPVSALPPGGHERRIHRLPTTDRGVYDAGPLEVVRRDPFGLMRRVHRHGEPQRVRVHPRIHALAPLPAGRTRHLEGPSSDASPSGTVTFHRLRDYVAGDDLRLIHWPSTARTGRLVVRHHVDTSQPFTVVLLDLSAAAYDDSESFEEAVDVAASVVVATSTGRAPVQLRLTDGTRLGGPRSRDSAPHIDALTEVAPIPDGSPQAELLALRHLRGGSSLVVVTGRCPGDSLSLIASLRRRFDRVVIACLTPHADPLAAPAGIQLLVARDAESLAAAWNAAAASGGPSRWRGSTATGGAGRADTPDAHHDPRRRR